MKGASRWTIGLVLFGAVVGIGSWIGLNTVLEKTSSLEFCISCHEMNDNVFAEYSTTAHYTNASGVRATCADCHIPKELIPKLTRKVYALNELYHHWLGTIDTPEKYDERRAKLAEHVWAGMKANDSRECSNCHSWEAMDYHKQTPRSGEKMEAGRLQGETCIDCHKGVAHRLPPRDD